MKINSKIIIYLLISFFFAAGLLFTISALSINHSQRENITLFKQEFVELGKEYFGDDSTLFFNGLDSMLNNSKPSTQTAINAINELDPGDTSVFIVTLSNQKTVLGAQNSNITSLVTKSEVSNYIQQNLLNQTINFEVDNYNAFLADKSSQIVPGEVHLKVYNNYGLMIGYGKTFTTGKVRIEYIQRQNQTIFRDALLLSLVAFTSVMAVSVMFTILRMRKIVILPLQAIILGLRRVEQGLYDTNIRVSTDDEIGKIATVFNRMTKRLKISIADLRNSRSKIEEQYRALNHDQVRLGASIESLDVGFIMTDADNEVIVINRTAKKILSNELTAEGASRTTSIAHPWTTDIVQNKLAKSFDLKDNLSKLTSTTSPIQIGELGYNGRALKLFMALVSDVSSAEQQPEKLGAVLLLDDITEEKIVERSKDEFFSIASHELRTPLTAIRGNTSMMQQYFADILKENGMSEMVDDIHSSSIRLIGLVNDFLDASRLEQGRVQYHFEAFSIDKIIEAVIYELGTVSKSRGVELNFADTKSYTAQFLPLVYGDKDRVKQIVYNLIGNALNYTEHGSVTVGVKQLQGHLKITITDTGRGMSPQAQQLLFHKFQQANDSILTRDTTRGTGLGLYISKLLIEQMHGQIQLESSIPDKGSTFSFTIPLAAEAQSQHLANQSKANQESTNE